MLNQYVKYGKNFMVNKLLKDLRSTTKSSEKIKLLKEFKDQELLKKILAYTYDNVTYTYGIKKIPEMVDVFGLDAERLPCSNLISLLDRLVDRTYTGNAAIEYVSYIMSSAKISGYSDLMKCILSRDLNAGVNEGLVEKIFPGIIKKPKVMLVSAFDQKKIDKNIRFPAIAQLKVDGARAILIKENQDIKILTRSGNEYLGLDHIKNVLKNISGNFVLDGEIIYNPSEDKCQNSLSTSPEERQLSNGIVNKSIQGTILPEESKHLQYVVWDFIDLDEYQKESNTTMYFERFNKLDNVIDNFNVIKVDSYIVKSLQEAKDLYKKYRAAGYEGIILKNQFMRWVNKRSQDAFKFKDEFDVDLKIVGYELHSKQPNKIGALLVESDDGLIKVSVGSGFKDSNTDDLMDRSGAYKAAMNNELIGKVVTVKCNSIIKSKDKEEYSLFLPRITCFRFDKTDTNLLSDFKD